MRKLKNVSLIILIAIAVATSTVSVIFCNTLSHRIEQLTRTSRADMIYLRGCVRNLEAELSATLSDGLASINRPTSGDPIAPPETDGESETEAETESSTDSETEPLPEKVLYTLAVHNERIGVFDTTGRVLCILNVFTPSLPAADLAALSEGIPIYSPEQLWEILDKYA